MNDKEDQRLEAFFAAARVEKPVPGRDFFSAILADAAEVSAEYRATRVAVPRPSAAWRLLDTFGGWRGAAALAACAVIGFWIGFGDVSYVPDGLSFESASSDTMADPVASFFDLASEES